MKAVFLDRDGTINEEMGYINHPERFRIFPFVAEALIKLKESGYCIVVITNQAGVAKGYFDESLLQQIHQNMIRELQSKGAGIDAIYYCPHHPTEGKVPYRQQCRCRKPAPGMVEQAVSDWSIDISHSVMIGDRNKDIVFARNLGMRAIMVMTGYGMGEYTFQRHMWQIEPDYICSNLLEAAELLTS